MYKHILSAVVLSCSLFLGQTAFAHFECPSEKLRQMAFSLNLDATQKQKIEAILTDMKAKVKESAASMKSLRMKIHEQENSANIDKSVVDQLVDEKVKLIANMMKAKIYAKNQIHQVLTDPQKEQLKAMIQKKEDKIAEMYKKCDE